MKLKERIELEQQKHRTKNTSVNSLFDFNEKANFITQSGHFHIKFKNGYEVSLFNGYGSYTDNLDNEKISDIDDEEIFSKYIELATIKDGYFCTREFIEDIQDDVIGLITSNELIDILEKVRNK